MTTTSGRHGTGLRRGLGALAERSFAHPTSGTVAIGLSVGCLAASAASLASLARSATCVHGAALVLAVAVVATNLLGVCRASARATMWTLGLVWTVAATSVAAVHALRPLTAAGATWALVTLIGYGAFWVNHLLRLVGTRPDRRAIGDAFAGQGLDATAAGLLMACLFLVLALAGPQDARHFSLAVAVGLAWGAVGVHALLPKLISVFGTVAGPGIANERPSRRGLLGLQRWSPVLGWLTVAVTAGLTLTWGGRAPGLAGGPWRATVLAAGLAAVAFGLWSPMGKVARVAVCALPAGLVWLGLAVWFPAEAEAPYLNGFARWSFVAVGLGAGALWSLQPSGKGSLYRSARAVAYLLAVCLAPLAAASWLLEQPTVAGTGLLEPLWVAAACLVLPPAVLALVDFCPPAARSDPRPTRAGIWRREGLATLGMTGYVPFAPGTFGALVALPVAASMAPLTLPARLAVALGFAALSVWIAERYVRRGADHDPSHVVVDEFAGCLLALVWVPWQAAWVMIAFLAFRALDITKPGPVGWAERRFSGGLGVVADDVVAGLGAGAGCELLRRAGATFGLWS